MNRELKFRVWDWFVGAFLTIANGTIIVIKLVGELDIGITLIFNILFFAYGLYVLINTICNVKRRKK